MFIFLYWVYLCLKVIKVIDVFYRYIIMVGNLIGMLFRILVFRNVILYDIKLDSW